MINFAEQASAIFLLIDFLLGIACGVIGSASRGSRREDHERTLLQTAPSALSEGARALLLIHTRDDDGYLQSLLVRPAEAVAVPRVDDDSESHGQGQDR